MDGEESVRKNVKAEDVTLTQAFTALFGVFMETLKVCILHDHYFNIDDDDDDDDDNDDEHGISLLKQK